MKVVVTGAAGFIGSHITRTLLAHNYAVVGLDDLSTGHLHNLPEAQEGWTFINGDIRDRDVCLEALDGADAVVHLAGRNSVPRSLKDPDSALAVNIMGGFNLLECARKFGCKRFIYASSSSVYGDDPRLPKEESHKLKPLSPYASSKASFEHLASAWHSSFGLHTIGLRFFNVFGARQDPDSDYAAVVPLFIRAALEKKQPKIYGDGTRTRDFTHVSNIAHAIRLCIQSADNTAGDVYNIACGGRITILDLWNSIAASAGSSYAPIFMAERPGDMPHSQANYDQAHQKLGFSPVTTFDDGIRQTVEWYRDNLTIG